MENADQEVVLIRDILARELETINTYQNLLNQAENQEVRDFLNHIIEEEKEHVAEAMGLINKFDPTQAALFGATDHYSHPSSEKTIEINKTEGKLQATPEAAFTVGSLRNPGNI